MPINFKDYNCSNHEIIPDMLAANKCLIRDGVTTDQVISVETLEYGFSRQIIRVWYREPEPKCGLEI